MVRTIARGESRATLDELLDAVAATGEPVVVEREGRPVAVIISPEDYADLRRLEDERDWAIIEAVGARNADRDPDEILAEVTAEVEAVRRERYEQQVAQRRH